MVWPVSDPSIGCYRDKFRLASLLDRTSPKNCSPNSTSEVNQSTAPIGEICSRWMTKYVQN